MWRLVVAVGPKYCANKSTCLFKVIRLKHINLQNVPRQRNVIFLIVFFVYVEERNACQELCGLKEPGMSLGL